MPSWFELCLQSAFWVCFFYQNDLGRLDWALISGTCLMGMTHVPEIGAENPYQKSGTINWHENRACHIRYQKLIAEKCDTKLHVRRITNR